MQTIDDLTSALPIRDIRIRAGTYGNCGGVILLTVDLEPGGAGGVEVDIDGADLPDWFADFPEEPAECVHHVGAGATAEFTERFGVVPDVRIVVRRAKYNPVDIIMAIGNTAGRRAVTEAIGRARLLAGLDASPSALPTHARAKTWERRLRVPIGLTYAGAALELDLKDVAHGGMGPHGMLLGGAGGGRTEAVHRIVSGLVSSHSPEQLKLLLLDAGEQAGFERFERLPQTMGVYQDLARQPSQRKWWEYLCHTELDYRRRLLAAAGFRDHAEYERARASGRGLEPLPSLLVVVDGFSDLLSATDTTEFMSSLVQLGRKGGRRGVHMLLTADGIGEGVLRGLDCFLPCRIGMRVSTVTHSRVVLGVNDAYDLPDEPGHAYLKVGTEALIRFQFGQVTEPLPAGG